jgi:hypothetical protein
MIAVVPAARSLRAAMFPTMSRRRVEEGLFLFDGDFGRFDYRKNGVTLFEIHSLD